MYQHPLLTPRPALSKPLVEAIPGPGEFVIPGSPWRPGSLQQCVDAMADDGWPDAEIRTRLRRLLALDAAVLIPPPTRSAQRRRTHLHESGLVVLVDHEDGSIHMMGDEKRMAQAKERLTLAFGEGTQVLPSSGWLEQENPLDAAPRDAIYVSSACTLIDRVIHGAAAYLRGAHPGLATGSNFEVFKAWMDDAQSRAGAERELGPAVKALTDAMDPWFRDDAGLQCRNIQLDADFAALALHVAPPPSAMWAQHLEAAPFYVDIQDKVPGTRSISGIFCRPAGGGGFRLTAIVEWTVQGWESVIEATWRDGRLEHWKATQFSDDIDPEHLQQVQEALYLPLLQDALQIVAVATTFGRGPQAAAAPLLPRQEVAARARESHKKMRAKQKTHSYFIVRRLSVPKDRFGYTGAVQRNRWSLDHIVAVSPHLRWQACGPAHSQRKLIWIGPHERGTGPRVRPSPSPELARLQPAVDVAAAAVPAEDSGAPPALPRERG